MEFPKEFKQCPICHSKKTLFREAILAVNGTPKPSDSFNRVVAPLRNPVLAVAVPGLMIHYDFCADCGMQYCVRAEIVQGAVQVQPKKEARDEFRTR